MAEIIAASSSLSRQFVGAILQGSCPKRFTRNTEVGARQSRHWSAKHRLGIGGDFAPRRCSALRFMESFDLQFWTRIGAMNCSSRGHETPSDRRRMDVLIRSFKASLVTSTATWFMERATQLHGFGDFSWMNARDFSITSSMIPMWPSIG